MWIRPDAAPQAAPQPEASSEGAARPTEFELIVEGGVRVSGPAVLRVRQGNTVTIRVVSDVADELHLHGYDRHLPLEPGEPATLELEAHLSGRFPYELHGEHVELGVLEVLPD